MGYDIVTSTKDKEHGIMNLNISENYIITQDLTETYTNSKISSLLFIMMITIGSISVYAGTIFSGFIAIIWVYVFNVFYSHFGFYPDPLIDAHSNKNFVLQSAVFGKNNQFYTMHMNSLFKAFITQMSIFAIAFIDYFLYGVRDKIAILYNIEFKQERPPELEFFATAIMLLFVVLIFNLRNILQIAFVSRRFGCCFSKDNLIFYASSLFATSTFFITVFSSSADVAGFGILLWFGIYISSSFLGFRRKMEKYLTFDIVWNEPLDVYFTILLSDGSPCCQNPIQVDSIAVIEDGSVILFDYNSNDIVKRKPNEISKIVLHDHGVTKEWKFDTSTNTWQI